MDQILDGVIIGAGAAGLTAAIYWKRSSLSFVLLDKGAPGGKLNNIHQIDNYPGLPHVSGPDLAMSFFNQATDLGVEVEYGDVQRVEKEGDVFVVSGDFGELRSKAVLVATGTSLSPKGVKGEKEHLGKGVSYCATCDGAFYKGKDVAVIGYQDHAVEDALYLSPLVNRLYFVFPKPLQASEEHERQLKACANVEWVNGKLLSVEGDPRVDRIEVQTEFGLQTISVSGVFPLSDEQSASIFLAPLAPMTEKGFLKVNEARMTSVPGLFAAGDVVDKKLRQIVNAAGEGAEAATSAMAYARAWRK